MTHQQGIFKGAGGLPLFYQSWQPEGECRGVVALVHGFGEHSGRHETIARPLLAEGFAVYGFDHRGHGHSPGKRGFIQQWSEFRDDVAAFLNMIRQENVARPLFLFGHSLGGLIVLEYALHHPQNLSGVIASAPLLAQAGISPLLISLSKVLSRLWPGLNLDTRLDINGISRDSAEAKRYQDDPLVHSLGTPRLATGIAQATAWTLAHAPEWKLPLYVYHGTGDTIVPISGSRTFFAQVNIPDKQWREFAEGRHELHHDLCRDEVFHTLIEWLNAHL
ncbi:MAG: lysophospholipase [Chloroflexi bacterium]|nr:lysophospholipase [Chloroflexota bacterium]MBP8055423.1 lysophospholipase [Chloroflexota bacterium]